MTAARGAAPSRSTETYRYLRLSIVLLALLLAASVAIEAWWGTETGLEPGSISAYYYTPVRGVFIGTLVAMGLGLIAIHGRDWGWEDALLNLSGMLATVVAFVPTPVLGTDALPCPADFKSNEKCVPLDFQDDVGNNVWALLFLAVVGLVVAAVLTRPSREFVQKRKQWLVGYCAAAVLVIAGGLAFGLDRDFFLRWAHYAAAIPMFGLLVVVGVINGMASDRARSEGREPPEIPGVTRNLKHWYFGLSVVMCGIVLSALIYALAVDEENKSHTWLFWVEVALLALFSLFWTLQTIDFWNEGLPPPGRGDPRPAVVPMRESGSEFQAPPVPPDTSLPQGSDSPD